MANIVKLGSAYLDQEPTSPGSEYTSGTSKVIELGETVPGKEISWVVVNGMLIADRCLLTHISWDNLNDNGLVYGKEITIDGMRYQARLLKVGMVEGEPNEWDDALDIVGESNNLWHWEKAYFWGQETAIDGYESHRALRGYSSARSWNSRYRHSRISSHGFRPALIPLGDAPHAFLGGDRVTVWFGQSMLHGKLAQFTDYDIVLSDWDGAFEYNSQRLFLKALPDDNLVIDRTVVSCIQKEDSHA